MFGRRKFVWTAGSRNSRRSVVSGIRLDARERAEFAGILKIAISLFKDQCVMADLNCGKLLLDIILCKSIGGRICFNLKKQPAIAAYQ